MWLGGKARRSHSQWQKYPTGGEVYGNHFRVPIAIELACFLAFADNIGEGTGDASIDMLHPHNLAASDDGVEELWGEGGGVFGRADHFIADDGELFSAVVSGYRRHPDAGADPTFGAAGIVP